MGEPRLWQPSCIILFPLPLEGFGDYSGASVQLGAVDTELSSTGLFVKAFFTILCQSVAPSQLRTYLADLMAAYNFARRLKTLSGLTPYKYICKIWTSEPDSFILNPIHQVPGMNT